MGKGGRVERKNDKKRTEKGEKRAREEIMVEGKKKENGTRENVILTVTGEKRS